MHKLITTGETLNAYVKRNPGKDRITGAAKRPLDSEQERLRDPVAG
jgi:hypothetical protein